MNTEKTMIRNLTEGSVPKLLLSFAWPFMLSNLLQTVYGLVDMVVIGQFVGSAGLSAVSIGGDLLHFSTFLCMGFASAGQILISQFVGKQDRESISRTIGTMFSFILGLGVVLTVVCMLCTDVFLGWLNTPVEALSEARSYTLVCFGGTVFIFGYNIVSSILRGMGDSKRPFVFISVAAVLNLVLDLLFVAGFHWDSFGAALATVIGQAVSFIGSMIYLYIKREAFGFDFKPSSFAIHPASLKMLLRLGIPMAIQYSAISVSGLFVNAMVNGYGVVVSAINGVGNKLGSIMVIVTNAFNAAGGSMIGQNLGAGKPERVRLVVRTTMCITVAAALFLTVIVVIWPEQVFGLFNTDPEVLAMSHIYVPFAVLNFFGFALRNPYNAVINGLGHATLGLISGLLDGVIGRIGLSVLFGVTLGMGIQGLWLGCMLAGYVPFVIGAVYYYSGRWKTRKLIVNQ